MLEWGLVGHLKFDITFFITRVHITCQAAWEPKAKRMLKFLLTDGSETVYAIEHEPLPNIVDPVSPGTKLVLVGPLIARRGIIMLTAKNVKVWGGCVEEMAEEFSSKKKLQSLIGQEDDEPFRTDAETVQHPTKRFVPKGLPMKYRTGVRMSGDVKVKVEPKNIDDTFDDGADDLLLAAVDDIPVTNNINDIPVTNNIKVENWDQDDFNDEDDDILNSIDLENCSSQANNSTSNNKRRRKNF